MSSPQFATTPKFKYDATTIAIITGASKGLGKTLALTLGKELKPCNHNVIVITGRDEEALQCTKSLINDLNGKHDVIPLIIDFGVIDKKWTDFWKTLDPILKSCDGYPSPAPFSQILLVHNAATVGPVSRRADAFNKTSDEIGHDDLAILSTFMAVNVNAPIILTSHITQAVWPNQDLNDERVTNAEKQSHVTLFIVNITSLLATQPMAGMSLYCSSKAAREMYFKVLALERSKYSNIAILNYAPGPLDTDMMTQVVSEIFDLDVRANFRDMKETLNLVPLDATSQKLLKVLSHGLYTSGDHVDYYDP